MTDQSQLSKSAKIWTHWDLNPGPSTCGADVIPLHHVPQRACAPQVLYRRELVGSSDVSVAGRHLGQAWPLRMCHMLPSCTRCCRSLDTLGFEPRAFRMRSGCDTTTPCAPQNMPLHRSCKDSSWWGSSDISMAGRRLGRAWPLSMGHMSPSSARCCRSLDTLGFEPRAFRMRSGCDTTTPCAPEIRRRETCLVA